MSEIRFVKTKLAKSGDRIFVIVPKAVEALVNPDRGFEVTLKPFKRK